MDTKWRKFSRSRAVKVLVLLLYIVCFGMVGIIAGYAPANGYDDNDYTYCIDSLFADSYMDSAAYANRLIGDYYKAEELFSRYANDYRSARFIVDFMELPFYCDAVIDGVSMSNNHARDHVYRVENYSEREQMISESTIPIRLKHVDFYTGVMTYTKDYIEIGYTQNQIDAWVYSWNIMRYNTQVIVGSSLALIIVGILLLAFSCRISGEEADGTVTWSNFYILPYEISLAVMVALGVLFVLLMLDGTTATDLCYSENGRTFFMFLCGLSAAAFAFALRYLCVSFAVRRKNKKALRGSLIGYVLILCFKVLKLLWKLLGKLGGLVLRFFGLIKEIFTGELYKDGTVARKLIFIDGIFIIVSCLLFIVIILSECAPLLLLEIVFLGLFIYGRYLLVRDEAKLEKQIDMIYSGNYGYKPEMGKNSPYTKASEQLSSISEQYRRGIEETIKAERTKMELVTNVSHDLKTPLTSIIGYIELLSKQELPEEAEEHVRILQQKSERLKNIVSDVFELAKTTSGEIKVEKEPLDLTKLSYQTLGEMEDRISASGLDIKVNICEPPVTVISDGKRLYRVIQNILDNALKYSLRGTRIYYTLEKRGGRAYITIKNIASYEMTFTKDEILERFTRGDKARSTEGTGLGLSIAQGFTLACGGTFDIDIDGDMFKVLLSFPIEAVNIEKTAVNADG